MGYNRTCKKKYILEWCLCRVEKYVRREYGHTSFTQRWYAIHPNTELLSLDNQKWSVLSLLSLLSDFDN